MYSTQKLNPFAAYFRKILRKKFYPGLFFGAPTPSCIVEGISFLDLHIVYPRGSYQRFRANETNEANSQLHFQQVPDVVTISVAELLAEILPATLSGPNNRDSARSPAKMKRLIFV